MQRAAASAILFLILGFGLFLTSHAQVTGADPLTLTIDPIYPRPHETVTVTPESTTFDIAAASITVSVNGSVVNRTSGAEPTYVTVGGPGSVTTISVTATSNGKPYTKSVSIRPADVALVVEADSTTHPFYQGGALTASEGNIRLVALPDLRTSAGAPIPADKLVYTWRFGNQVLEASSGIGKSVLSASAPPRYRDAQISVTVTSQDQSIVAQATTLISPVDPLLRVYRNDPLLGPMFSAALPENYTMNDTEDTFRAVPYYFAARPTLAWDVNGTGSGSAPDITVRSSGGGTGTALVGVTATLRDTLQTAGGSLSVHFGQTGSFNFFGL